jgi:hypothetical protein
MSFWTIFGIFIMFLYFAWQEYKEGNNQWAVVFLISSFAFLIMALVVR